MQVTDLLFFTCYDDPLSRCRCFKQDEKIHFGKSTTEYSGEDPSEYSSE